MTDEVDDFLPLSALNDFLFCARRCALHRVEGVWIENAFTLEGSLTHRRVHAEQEEMSGSFRLVRGLWLKSRRLGLVGKADLVEFRPVEGKAEIPYPVEFKRGKRRRWDNDDAQLCAQALCLEEMLDVSVPAGAIYHLRSRRRREVVFDAALRRETEDAIRRLHQLVASGITPAPVLHAKCKRCSLHDLCLPEILSNTANYQRAAKSLFIIES